MSTLTDNPVRTGDSGANLITGDDNDEIIHGLGGGDTIFGGAGDDTLIGAAGVDVLTGDAGADVLYGGAGNDILSWDSSLETDPNDVDRLWGEEGTDTLVLNFSSDDYSTAIADEIAAYVAALAAGQDPGAGGEYSFTTFQLRVLGIENVLLFIDGAPVSPGELPGGTALNDAFDVDDNADLSGDVTANDSFDPQTQTIRLVQGVLNGELVLNADGTFSFLTGESFLDLSEGETATETFTYAIDAGQTQLSTATVTITINGVNEAPSALDVQTGTSEDDPVSLNLLDASLASDVDANDTLSIKAVDGQAVAGPNTVMTLASGATVTVSPDGTFTYDPSGAFDFLGSEDGATETVSFTVADDKGAAVTQVLRIDVSGVNDAPIALDDAATTDEATPVEIDVLANDLDPDSVLSIDSFDDASDLGGAVSLGQTGLVFDPLGDFDFLAAGESVDATFAYTAIDDDGEISSALVTVTVTGANEAPTAIDVQQGTDEDTAISFNLLTESEASDADANDVLTISEIEGVAIAGPGTSFTLASGAVVTASPDGAVTYDPSGAFDFLAPETGAQETLTFTVTDSAGATVTRSLVIGVDGVNDAPVAVDDAAATDEDTAIQINVAANDMDADSASLTYFIPENTGSFGFADAVVDYTGAGDPSRALGPGDGVFVSLPTGQSVTLAFLDEIITDGAGDDLFIGEIGPGGEFANIEISSDGVNFTFLGVASNDTVSSFDIGAVGFTGELRFVRVTGLDNGGSAPGFDLDFVQAIGTAVEGLRGDVTDLGGGVLSYDPGSDFDFLAAGEVATETFSYVVSDGDASDIGVVTVTVTGRNDAPDANEVSRDTDEDTPLSFNLLDESGASDPDAADTLTLFAVNGVELGGQTISVDSDLLVPITVSPDGFVDYDPTGLFDFLDVGESSFDSFTFTIVDGSGATVQQTATIEIRGVNDAPVAVDDAAVAAQNDAVDIDVLANDVDPDDPLVITAFDAVGDAGGVITATAGGLRFDPNGEFDFLGDGESAVTRFTYTVTDDDGASSTATVTVRVGGGNEAPTGAPVFLSTDEDTATAFNLISESGATDPDAGDTLTVTAVNGTAISGATSFVTVAGVVVTVSPDGSVVIDPAGGFDALDVEESVLDDFTFTISDAAGASFTETATIEITGVNDAPVAVDDAARTDEDTSVGIDVLANDADPDDDLVISGFDAAGTNGGVVLAGAGGLVFDPNGEFEFLAAGDTAVSSFTYTLTDDDGETSTATVTVTIDGANDAPTADDFSRTTDEDSALSFDLLSESNASDVDQGDTLTILSVNGISLNGSPVTITTAGGGSLTVSPDGSATFDPAGAFDALGLDETATDSFTFTITDAVGATVQRTATIDVTGVNDPPVTVDDTATTDEDTDVEIDVLANDFDPDDALRITAFDDAGDAGGTVSSLGSTLLFDPNGDFDFLAEGETAETSFTYTVTDDAGASSTASVAVTVTGVNDAPVGNGAALTTDEDTALSDNLIVGRTTDVDVNDTLAVSRVNGAALAGGVATVNFDSGAQATILADGSVAFDPAGFYDFLGDGETVVERFTFVVADDKDGETGEQTATITITGANDAPIGQAFQITTTEDDATSGDLLDGAIDPEDDGFSLSAIEGQSLQDTGVTVTLASGAVVSAGIAGTFTYDPNGAFESLAEGDTATDSFTYTLRDEFGAAADFTVTITIEGQNDGATFAGTRATAVSLVSVTADGTASGNFPSITPQISGDGASVAFVTNSTNLVTPDANGSIGDVLLADLDAGTLEQVNLVDGTTTQSTNPASTFIGVVDGVAGGRWVVFHSGADDLNDADNNGQIDVYLRDLDTGATELISVNIDGQSGNANSLNGSVSADGRYVAFQSTATDLVSDDLNGSTADVFLRDRLTGETIKISSPEGGNNRFSSFNPRISEDGSTVVFATFGALVDEDQNGVTDVYAYDVETKTLELVSLGDGGVLGNGGAQEASVSANGRYVFFSSDASNLVAGDTNGLRDGFVYDRVTGATERVTVSTSGAEADAAISFGIDFGQISADGRFVIFTTTATNLDEITPDTNDAKDVFLHDRLTGETVRLSVTIDLTGQAGGFMPSISADGTRAAFATLDTPDPLDPRGADNFEDVYVADIDINGAGFATDDGTVTIGLLDGFADPEGDDLDVSGVTVTSDNGRSVAFSVDGETGALTIDARQFEDNAPGDYELLTISYSIDSADGESVGAIAGASVFRSIPAGGATVAVDDNFTTDEDVVLNGSVADNDTPATGGAYSLVSGIAPEDGFLTFNTDGSFTYNQIGRLGFLGDGETAEVSFTYELDFGGVTSQATATIEVIGQNDRPAYRAPGAESYSLVSLSSRGFSGADADAFRPDLSTDGSFISFESAATNLVDGDTNGQSDVFVGSGVDGVPVTRVSLLDGFTVQTTTGDSSDATVAADGAVAFQSDATNLVSFNTGGQTNVYVREGAGNVTEIISLNFEGALSDGDSFNPSISSDGRYVAFESTATDLVEFSGDDNGAGLDVFVYDRLTGEMISVTQDSDRTDTGASFAPTISADGTRVVFLTENSYDDLDDNSFVDVYAYDLRTGEYIYVSQSADFGASDGDAFLSDLADIGLTSRPTISDNGRYVAYVSQAENLTFDDTNGFADVFLYDIEFGFNQLVSVNINLEQGDDVSYAPAISGDGRFIAYETLATNLELFSFSADTDGLPDIMVFDQVEFDIFRLTFGSDVGGSQPTISDDGGRIAFVSDSTDSYDFRVSTTGVQNVYIADMRVNGITVDDNFGEFFVDLAKDIIDDEGDRLFFDNINVFTDNGSRTVNFTVPTDAGGVPLSGILIDFSQFDDLGVGDYELVTVNSTVSDELGGAPDGAGNFAIVVKGANDDPVAVDESFTVNPGDTFLGAVNATDVDGGGSELDGDVLTFTADATGFPGTFTIDPDGSFTAIIDNGASGTFTVDVLVSDPFGGSDTATLTFTVNGGPDFNGFVTPFSAVVGQDPAIDAGAAFSDPSGTGLTFTTGRTDGGQLTGGLTIDPATGVIGGVATNPGVGDLLRIFVTATDGLGGSTTAENWLTITDNIVTGTDGGDVLTALTNPALDGATSNLIFGGLGNDLLNGFEERDIYVWRAGDGFDLIQDDGSGDLDRVIITGVAESDIVLSRFGADDDDLLFEVRGTEGTYTSGFVFRNGIASNFSAQLDQILLDDGTIITLADIRARVGQASVDAGGTTVAGTQSSETLQGSDGAVLIGNLNRNNGGADTYLFNPGDGAITVDTFGGTSASVIQIGFNLTDSGTGAPTFTVRRVPGTTDVVLDFGGGDVLTVVDTLEEGGGAIASWIFLDTTVGTGFFRNAILTGEATAGDDILLGFDGPNLVDVLAGGPGDDYLAGSDGGDIYNYAAGDGNDTIEDTIIDPNVLNVSGFDLIFDGSGLVNATSEVSFRRVTRDNNADPVEDDLLIELDGAAGTGSITIFDQLDTRPLGAVQTINFDGPNADATLDIAALRALLVAQDATAGDDVIRGFDQSTDTLAGGAGDDSLLGGDSTDLYLYAAGDGNDTIYDDGFTDEDRLEVSGFDLIFDANGLVSEASEVRFSQPAGSGSDLLISLDNGADTGAIVVERFFDFNAAFVIENFSFAGDLGTTEIRFDAIYSELLNRQATDGDDIILSPVNAGFNETVASGQGDDIVGLGAGNDTYLYSAGDGRLRIIENGFAGTDTLEISGYTFDELEFDLLPYFLFGANPNGFDLRLRPTTPVGADDEIIILNGYTNSSLIGIDSFVDGAGATLTKQEVIQRVIDQAVANGDPFITGSNTNDLFGSTPDADVFIYGRSGADAYTFAAGDGWDTYREDGFGGTDTITLAGYSSSDVGSTISFQTGTYRPDDVWIDFGGGDRLYVVNTDQFESIVFGGDGVSFNRTAFDAFVAANASVIPDINGDGDFTFNSTAADERLDGLAGSDTANFTIGQIGHDIIEQGFQGRVDITINLGATGQVAFERGMYNDGGDLVIKVFQAGASELEDIETIRLTDFQRAANTSFQSLTLVTATGTTVLGVDDVLQAATDGYVTGGDDVVYGFSGAIVSIVDGRGNEFITGGAGDDILKGFGGVEDNLDGFSQQDVYQFVVGDGGTGGDGRDYILDDAFGDGDRIEFVSIDGSGAAALDKVRIYFAPDDTNDIVFDFGMDELRVGNLDGNGITARYQEIVFDFGGAAELTLTDEQVVALAVAGQTTNGDDTILGSPLADVLNGGPGDDLLQGFGNPQGDVTDPAVTDIYLYNVGAGGSGGGGRDVIHDVSFGDTDVIRITSDGQTNGAASASLANAVLRRDGADQNSLIIDFGADELTIRDFLSDSIATDYAQIVFDFGGANETFTKEGLLAEFLLQSRTDGDDDIVGTYLDEELRGGLGDDTITGGGGSDTYVFTPGQGDDVMIDLGSIGTTATVRIEADFADVEFFKRGSESEDFLIRFNAGGSVLILDAFLTVNTRGEIDALVFDDVSFTPQEIQALALAADIARGSTRLISDNFDDVDRAIDTDGDGVADVTVGAIRGTAANEFMSGQDGADTYIYTVGDGSHDVIHEQSFSAQTDRLVIDGALPEDVIFSRAAGDLNDDNDLLITFRNAEGSIRIIDTIDTNARDNVEEFVLIAPGGGSTVTLSLAEARQRIFQDAPTARDDRIVGVDDVADTLTNIGADASTAGGSDVLIGLAGGDTYVFQNVTGVAQRLFVKDGGQNADQDMLDVRGYTSGDVTIRRLAAATSDFVFNFTGGEDAIVLHNVAGADLSDRIETFLFDDGAFTLADVIAAVDGDGTLGGGIGVGPGAPLIGGPMADPLVGGFSFEEPSEPFPEQDPGVEEPPAPVIETVVAGGPEDIGAGTGGGKHIGRIGGAGADALRGTGASEAFNGRGGADLISGLAGDDTARGGGGADTLKGGGGADLLLGGGGRDVLLGGSGDDVAKGQAGADRLVGHAGDDRLFGGGGNDRLVGNRGDDLLKGGGGGDTLNGGAGRDKLFGQAGDDLLSGGGGVDRLVGGVGDDTLKGGGGADQFVFAGRFGEDLVKDFQIGLDHLNFRGHSGVSSLADLEIDTLNGDAVIRDGLGGVIVLDGVDGDDLGAGDFLF